MSEVSIYGATLADEETVVGAAKREQSLGTVASAVTVLTSDQIRRYGYRTLAEALRSVGGIFIVDDRMVERVGVRGIQLLGDANTRTLILIDGTPLNEPWSQFVDGSTALPVSLDDVARIEVIRGPVSSIYGTNAFLGIINIVTIEADKAPKVYGRLSVGTFGTFGGNAAFNQGDLNRQFRGSIGYSNRIGESISYPEFAGEPLMTTSADGADALFGSFSMTYDRVFFQARAYNRKRELPGAPYESEIGSDDNTNRDRHYLAEVGYTQDFGERVTLAGRLYANRYEFENKLDYGMAAAAFSTEASSLWYGGEVRALVDVLPTANLLSVTGGVALEQTSTESTATTKTEPIETDFSIAGVYLEGTTAPVDWLGATVGARFDRNSKFTSELSPRAALFLHKGEEYGAKLLYAEGFRNPSILEAFYDDDQRFSPPVYADGSTQLRPETITAYEVVGYGRPLPGLKLRVSAWEWRLSDLLKRDLVDDPIDNERRLRYQNTATLVSRGVEVESTWRNIVGRAAYANLALAFTGRSCLASDRFDNLLLDPEEGNCDHRQNAPVTIAKVGVSSELLFDLVHLSTELTYQSERGTQDPDVELPQWVGWNLVVYLPDVRGFDITVGGRNILGREEVAAQSDYNRSNPSVELLRVPGPGREAFARVGHKF